MARKTGDEEMSMYLWASILTGGASMNIILKLIIIIKDREGVKEIKKKHEEILSENKNI